MYWLCMYVSKMLEEVFLWAWIVKDCITTICEMKKLPILKSSTDLTKSIWPNNLYKNHWGYNFGYILAILVMIDFVEWIHTYALTYTHTYICIAIMGFVHFVLKSVRAVRLCLHLRGRSERFDPFGEAVTEVRDDVTRSRI